MRRKATASLLAFNATSLHDMPTNLSAPSSSRNVEASVAPLPASLALAGSELLAIGVLSAVAGYVDAAGFLGLFGWLTAHVTGDLVTMGTVIGTGGRWVASARVVAIPVFMLSAATAATVARATRRRGQRPLPALFALMTLSLGLFCATGVLLAPRLHGWANWAVVVTGATGVAAMGIQNAIMRDALNGLPPTTIMTGNITQIALELVDAAFAARAGGAPLRPGARRRELRRRLVRLGTPVMAFACGTILGSAITAVWGLWSIALPATAAGALTVLAWRPRTVAKRPTLVIELALKNRGIVLGDALDEPLASFLRRNPLPIPRSLETTARAD
jgi:uncharacterized membrane protein YoaK (UPF0700 family)